MEQIEAYKEDDIMSSYNTVHTLEAATWSFLTTGSYEEAVIRAANLGDDADTVAAVCGALAGAYYGYSAIPGRWRDQLQDEGRIRKTALALGGCADATRRIGLGANLRTHQSKTSMSHPSRIDSAAVGGSVATSANILPR